MTDILMPKLSDSMEKGTIISWFKVTGDRVELGDELLEIETDKSTAPYEAETSGVLEVLVPVGSTVPVGEPIARMGSGAPALSQDQAAGLPSPDLPVPVVSRGVTTEQASEPSAIAPAAAPQSNGAGNGTDSAKVTPLARRVAAAHGVNLNTVRGSGPLGRITRADVLNAAGIDSPAPIARSRASAPAAKAPAQQPMAAQVPQAGGQRQETHPPPATRRAPHGQIEIDDPALPGANRGGYGRSPRAATRAEAAGWRHPPGPVCQ